MKDLAKPTNGELKKAILKIKDNYADDTRIFVNFLESNNLDISYEGLSAFVKHLNQVHDGKRLSAETINKRIKGAKNRIRFIFEHSPESLDLEKAYKLEKALREVKLKKTSKSVSQEKVLMLDEIKVLIDQTSTANPAVSLMIEFLAYTGCRISEILNVLVTDMKQSKGYWKIRIAGKGGKERSVLVGKDLIARVTAHFAGQKYLFEHNQKQYRREYVSMQIKRAGRKYLNKDISAHTLRHSFATDKLKRTKNLKGVSQYLGHSSTSTTADLYVHDELTWDDIR